MHTLMGPAVSHLAGFPADTLARTIQDLGSLQQNLSREGREPAYMPFNKEFSEETKDYVIIS